MFLLKKSLVMGVTLLLLGGGLALLAQSPCPVKNEDTAECFTTIQAAIADVDTLDGHTITVQCGDYYENLIIDKSITLIGADRWCTNIRTVNPPYAVKITANEVTITGFSIYWQGSHSAPYSGIKIESHENVIDDNNIFNCPRGIYISNTTGNIVSDNSIATTFHDWEAIAILGGSNNKVYGNMLSGPLDQHGFGIELIGTSGNKIFANSLRAFNCGIYLFDASNNRIHHNNFENNLNHTEFVVWMYPYPGNQWHNGYPSGGNYWDDHPCNDGNLDSICDDPCWLYGVTDVDYYPLAGGWSLKCGNVDGSPDHDINQQDIDYLLDYMFGGGPDPVPPCSADVNGDGSIDIGDVTYLINFVHQGGPAPTNCPCRLRD